MLTEAYTHSPQPAGFHPMIHREDPRWLILPENREAMRHMSDMAAQPKGHQEFLWLDGEIGLIISDIDLEASEKLCVLEGKGQLSLQFRLDAASFEKEVHGRWSRNVAKPCVLVRTLPEGMSFYQKVESKRWRTVTVCIPERSLKTMLGQEMDLFSGDSHNVINSLPYNYFYHQLPISPRQYFILSDILKSQPDSPLRELYLEAKALELLFSVIQSLYPEAPELAPPCPLSRRDICNLQMARDILTDNYDNPPTLLHLARMVGLNRRKLTQGFKYLFGVTVYEYCISLRMEQAQKLLLQDSVPVSHVALKVGYKNPSSFTKVFKRHFGFLPSDLGPLSLRAS